MNGQKDVVGLIGTGYMGHGIGGCLLDAGYALNVHDVRRETADDLVARGARFKRSAREVAAASDVVLISVVSADQVQEVLFGRDGVASAESRCESVIDTTTVPPGRGREFARGLAAEDVQMLDAPVIGGTNQGKSRTMPVGGAPEVFRRHRPMLRSVAERVIYIGPSGSGHVVKMMNQLMVCAEVAAAGEAYTYAERMGIDLARALEALCPERERPLGWVAGAVERQADPTYAGDGGHWTKLFLKDMNCVLEAGFPMPVARAVRDLADTAMEVEPERGWPYSFLAATRRVMAGDEPDDPEGGA